MILWVVVLLFAVVISCAIINFRLSRLEKRMLDMKNMQTNMNPITNERLTTILDHVRVVERVLHGMQDKISVEKATKKKLK